MRWGKGYGQENAEIRSTDPPETSKALDEMLCLVSKKTRTIVMDCFDRRRGNSVDSEIKDR